MLTCKNCGKLFPITIKINGERKNLHNRKYCLECSPWGQHNTKKIEIDSTAIGVKKCFMCGEIKQHADFYIHKCGRLKISAYCKECSKKERIERYRCFKKKCVDYLGGKCKLCGYNKCMEALDFHHTDKNEKEFGIANIKNNNFEKVKKELDKCILLCCRCHRELHYGQ
jgi:hypothetical protein